MKRYVLITNIWGRVPDKYQGWNYKNPFLNKIVIDKEKIEFDLIKSGLIKDYKPEILNKLVN